MLEIGRRKPGCAWHRAAPTQPRSGHVGDLTALLPVRAVHFGVAGQPRLGGGKTAAGRASAQPAVMARVGPRLMRTGATDPSRNTDQGV